MNDVTASEKDSLTHTIYYCFNLIHIRLFRSFYLFIFSHFLAARLCIVSLLRIDDLFIENWSMFMLIHQYIFSNTLAIERNGFDLLSYNSKSVQLFAKAVECSTNFISYAYRTVAIDDWSVVAILFKLSHFRLFSFLPEWHYVSFRSFAVIILCVGILSHSQRKTLSWNGTLLVATETPLILVLS